MSQTCSHYPTATNGTNPLSLPSPLDGTPSDDLATLATLARLIEEVWDPTELKTTLTVALHGGLTTPVAEGLVFADERLRRGLRSDGSHRSVEERIGQALEVALARGTILRLVDENDDAWLLIGTDDNQRLSRSVANGLAPRVPRWVGRMSLERPSIFTLYEQNIGLVTPIIADRLVEAVERYPESWIEDAISEAVSYNRRSWRYVQRILENWATEGRTNEADRGAPTRDLSREKHLRGKYAHLFQRDDLPDL